MKVDGYKIVTVAENPALRSQSYQSYRAGWQEFMLHDATALRFKEDLATLAARYQFFLVDDENFVVAICKSIPFYWDGQIVKLPQGEYDSALATAVHDLKAQKKHNALLGLSVTIPHEYRNKGVSSSGIKAMRLLCEHNSIKTLLLPVRPSLKSKYPLTNIEDYIRWKDNQGLAFDPWLRTHEKLGGKILKVAKRSMVIKGNISEWESWTDILFPATGKYIIPGALCPVLMNREKDVGLYVEPNVWVLHTIR